jgi:hypothetical protein
MPELVVCAAATTALGFAVLDALARADDKDSYPS